ncbi:hypothetical protein AtNW77_Chr1g0019051 [Arabidopsis thaliana]
MCIILHSCTARLPQAQNLQIELKQDQVQASFKSNEKKTRYLLNWSLRSQCL